MKFEKGLIEITYKISLLFVLLLLGFIPCTAGVFDQVSELPSEQRIGKAEEIYLNNIRFADSAYAFREIKSLISVADKINDLSLESIAWSMLADKYARYYGYNERSTSYHLKAIKIAENYNQAIAYGIAEFKFGRYYYTFKRYPQAFEFLLKANNIFIKEGYNRVPSVFQFLYLMGRIYFEIGDYGKAEYFLTKEVLDTSSSERMRSYNILATIAEERNDFVKAMTYAQKVLDIANAQHDSAWQGIASGDVGGIYFRQKVYDKAFPYLEKGYQINSHNSIWDEANKNVLELATICLIQNDLTQSEKYLKLSQQYLPLIRKMTYLDSADWLKGRKLYYEFLAAYYEKKNNTDSANTSLTKLLAIKDSLAIQKNIEVFNNIGIRIAAEQYLSELARLDAEAKTSVIKRNAIIIILLLLLGITFLIYNRQRLKRKAGQQIAERQQALLASEKLRAEEELQNAQQQLKDFTENLSEKNELIDNIKKELFRLQTISNDGAENERLEYFERLVQSTILTDESWNEFRQLFEKVHKGFIFRLKERFHNLSENDIQNLCLYKLQLSKKEMANMLGVSYDAIKKSRQRLNKKIRLYTGEDKDIENVISTI